MTTTRPKGTNDFLPEDTAKWQYVESVLRELAQCYSFEELRTPIFESTELFLRGVGETTDIVNKEMYTFEDKGGRSITLRPEGTASAARAFIEHKLHGGPQPVKLWYTGPMFRYERPQKGRFRQFHQFGLEAFGSQDPALDAEIISFAMSFYEKLGLTGLEVRLNSVGCPKCRKDHKEKLQDALRPVLGELCDDCQSRFEKNPLRIFDCKNDHCKELIADAPTILDCLCDECHDHFEKVKTYLTDAGIPFHVDPHLVRGLDYYTKTAFEVLLTDIGAQSAICGGGRYDGLIKDLGGPETYGVGFALGMERVFSAMEAQSIALPEPSRYDVYFVALGDAAKEKMFPLLTALRKEGVKGEIDFLSRSLKAQMKAADRVNARFTVIAGEEELQNNEMILRDMADKSQVNLSINDMKEELIRRIK
ncbi:MAG: histidine--tRNA ligase [Bacillota bacterium]|nr:histidine--tRNA ligase [Bacillota bacterium]